MKSTRSHSSFREIKASHGCGAPCTCVIPPRLQQWRLLSTGVSSCSGYACIATAIIHAHLIALVIRTIYALVSQCSGMTVVLTAAPELLQDTAGCATAQGPPVPSHDSKGNAENHEHPGCCTSCNRFRVHPRPSRFVVRSRGRGWGRCWGGGRGRGRRGGRGWTGRGNS